MSRRSREYLGILWYRWYLAGGFAAWIAVVSLLPSGKGPLEGWDTSISSTLQNSLHLPAYAILAWLVCSALSISGARIRTFVGMLGGCVLYGAVLECVQAAWIPGRCGSISDAIWNTAGVCLGAAIWSGFFVALGQANLGRITADSRKQSSPRLHQHDSGSHLGTAEEARSAVRVLR